LVGHEDNLLELFSDALNEDKSWAEQYVATGELRLSIVRASLAWKSAISEQKIYKALGAYAAVPEMLEKVLTVGLSSSSILLILAADVSLG
jgi:predicted nucleic acid-binding protein